MSEKDAHGANEMHDLRDWFWARGVSFLSRALSLHGLSGAFLLLGDEGHGPDEQEDTSEGADDSVRPPRFGLAVARAAPLGRGDELYELARVRPPLAAFNPVTC